jgi:hypothetical protein
MVCCVKSPSQYFIFLREEEEEEEEEDGSKAGHLGLSAHASTVVISRRWLYSWCPHIECQSL